MAVRSILALYPDPLSAADGVNALREAGFPQQNLELLTGAPYPPGAFGEAPVRHKLHLFPLVGALCGFVVGLLLTIGTQLSFPLVTGGKPVVSIPPTFIILYEGTLLGAIAMTMVGFLFEARLPRPSLGLYDPRINEGYVGILVTAEETDIPRAVAAFRQTGAEEVIREAREEG